MVQIHERECRRSVNMLNNERHNRGGARTDLECDPLPMWRVDGLHDGHGRLKLPTASEKLTIKCNVRWKLFSDAKPSKRRDEAGTGTRTVQEPLRRGERVSKPADHLLSVEVGPEWSHKDTVKTHRMKRDQDHTELRQASQRSTTP